MVTLASFIIETDHALTIFHQGKAVFEFMRTSCKRSRDAPHLDLDETAFVQYVALLKKKFGTHVGVYTNTPGLLSKTPTG